MRWSGAPKGTQSFVVTLFDMDEHNTPSGWWHWVVYDLPANATELPAGAGVVNSKTLPAAAHQGRTDLGTDAYHGPCPDKGDKPHRYVFTIYALKVPKLSVPPDPEWGDGGVLTAGASVGEGYVGSPSRAVRRSQQVLLYFPDAVRGRLVTTSTYRGTLSRVLRSITTNAV